MASLGIVLTVLSALAAGLGTYLYNDGHDHKIAGKVSVVAGWLGWGISSWIGAEKSNREAYACTLYHQGCPEIPDSLLLAVLQFLWAVLGSGLIEATAIIIACGIGYLLAILTRRTPQDGRPRDLLPND